MAPWAILETKWIAISAIISLLILWGVEVFLWVDHYGAEAQKAGDTGFTTSGVWMIPAGKRPQVAAYGNW